MTLQGDLEHLPAVLHFGAGVAFVLEELPHGKSYYRIVLDDQNINRRRECRSRTHGMLLEINGWVREKYGRVQRKRKGRSSASLLARPPPNEHPRPIGSLADGSLSSKPTFVIPACQRARVRRS